MTTCASCDIYLYFLKQIFDKIIDYTKINDEASLDYLICMTLTIFLFWIILVSVIMAKSVLV